MDAGRLFIVLGWPHYNFGIGHEVEFRKLGVLVEELAVVFKREVCEEKCVDVRIKVLSQFEQ